MSTLNDYDRGAVETARAAAGGCDETALLFLQQQSAVKPIIFKKSISTIDNIVQVRMMLLAFTYCMTRENSFEGTERISDLIQDICEKISEILLPKTNFFVKNRGGFTYTLHQSVLSPLYMWKEELCDIHNRKSTRKLTPECVKIIFAGKNLNSMHTAKELNLMRENSPTAIFEEPTEIEFDLLSQQPPVLSINQSLSDLRHYMNYYGNDAKVLRDKLKHENDLLNLGYELSQIRRFLSDCSYSFEQVCHQLEEKKKRDEESQRLIAMILETEGGS